jgi:hypothetical protein
MKRFILMVLVLFSISANAQSIIYDNDPLLENFGFQVRQISEFMSRLNGKTSLSENTDTIARQLDLASLFKKEVFFENRSLAEEFINTVLSDGRYIDFTDTTWYARAKCAVVLNDGHEHEVSLILKTEEYGPYLYKWVIADASGDLLSLSPDKRNPGLRISPTDNEVNFMSLSHISRNENRNILNYAVRDYTPDPVTVLYTLLYNGLMEIKHVKELSYVFKDVAGYRLTVNHYPGDDRNCGWLISEIRPNVKCQPDLPYVFKIN